MMLIISTLHRLGNHLNYIMIEFLGCGNVFWCANLSKLFCHVLAIGIFLCKGLFGLKKGTKIRIYLSKSCRNIFGCKTKKLIFFLKNGFIDRTYGYLK